FEPLGVGLAANCGMTGLPNEPFSGGFSIRLRPSICLQFEQVRICWTDVVRELGDLGIWSGSDSCDNTANEARNSLPFAPRDKIESAIWTAYDLAAVNNEKPPNINEIAKPVQTLLAQKGYQARSDRQIKTLAGAPEYQSRRRRTGRTIKSEGHRQKRPDL